MGALLGLQQQELDPIEPVFVIPRNIYFTPAQMSIMIEAGQQPGVPFRVGGNGASRPQRNITKTNIVENFACIDKNSFKITVNDFGKFFVTFNYDSIVPLTLYIHFGARDVLSPDEIRPQNTMLHWGPFSLKSGKKTLWSSEYENLYGDVVNLPCTGGNLIDAVVILDTSNPTATPRAVEYEDNEVNNKGWNLQNNNSNNNNNNSNSLGRFLAPQPHHKTKSPNLEYSMTSSQSDAHRSGHYISKYAAYFLARPPVPQFSSKDQSSEAENDSSVSVATSSSNRKKSRNPQKKGEKSPATKPMRIPPSYRGPIATKCVLQRVQSQQTNRVFVIEDLYGMDTNNNGGTNNENNDGNGNGNNDDDGGLQLDNDAPECVICLTDPKEVAVYPCRHMCMCLTCAEALPSQHNKCPMCRRPALLLLRLKSWNVEDSKENQINDKNVDDKNTNNNNNDNNVNVNENDKLLQNNETNQLISEADKQQL